MFLSVSAQVFSQSYGAYVPVSLSTSVQSELRCRICSCQSQHKCSVRVTVQNMFLSVSAQVFSQSYGAYVPVSLSTSVQSELWCICSCQSQHKCSVRVTVQNMSWAYHLTHYKHSPQMFTQFCCRICACHLSSCVITSVLRQCLLELCCKICFCHLSYHKCSHSNLCCRTSACHL